MLESLVSQGKIKGEAKVANRNYQGGLIHFMSPSHIPLLYTPYVPLGDTELRLPFYVVEQQNDHVRGHAGKYIQIQVQSLAQSTVTGFDDKALPPRPVLNRQKKFGLKHDGSIGDNAARKKESERFALAYLEACNAWPILDFLRATADARLEIDDMTDALLLMLEVGSDSLIKYHKATQGVRKSTARRTGVPADPNGRAIRIYACDPGTRRFAHILGEVNALLPCMAPFETPLPCFRVFRLELLDFIDRKVLASFSRTEETAKFYSPVGDSPSRILELIDEATKVDAERIKRRRREGAKRAAETRRLKRLREEEEEEGDYIPPPAKKVKKDDH